ncbi:LysE family translocator [Priestia koreensis]|uniref:LysE family translocator n=1 Tax=Priestia koreensis TaxID=284581 RepID=UPI001F569780|nr:LysE family transporter [Priestia koreensis]MCM3004780.1 LysE family translocator [Priestia koreensis]UNL85579.1 LysE family transporter [Priestia koreensis]
MGVLLSYILLGLSLAAPIGPINAAQLDKGIKNGFWHSWFLGMGATFVDILYMLAVYIGAVSFLSNEFIKLFLFAFGCFVLIYTGVEGLISAGKINRDSRAKGDTILKCFFSGFFLSITNPLTILFWIGIYGSVLAKTASTYGEKQLLLYSGAMFIGIFAWDVTMAALASTFRRYLAANVLIGVSVVSGLSLVGFGLYFGWQALQLLLH